MSGSNKSEGSAEGELGVFFIVGSIAFLAIAFFLPLFMLSLPFAMMLSAAVSDERPLFNFVFVLVIGLTSTI
jgi:hypothetical protein